MMLEMMKFLFRCTRILTRGQNSNVARICSIDFQPMFQLPCDVSGVIIHLCQGTTEAKEITANDDQIFLQQLQVGTSFV